MELPLIQELGPIVLDLCCVTLLYDIGVFLHLAALTVGSAGRPKHQGRELVRGRWRLSQKAHI